MSKTKKPKKLERVNQIQGTILDLLSDGVTANRTGELLGIDRCSLWDRTSALRWRGLVSEGKPGVAGSVKSLVRPHQFLVRARGYDGVVRCEVPIQREDVSRDVFGVAREILDAGRENWFKHPLGGGVAVVTALQAGVLLDALIEAGWAGVSSVEHLRVRPPVVGVDEALPELERPLAPGVMWVPPDHPDYPAWVEYNRKIDEFWRRHRERARYVCSSSLWELEVLRLCRRIVSCVGKK